MGAKEERREYINRAFGRVMVELGWFVVSDDSREVSDEPSDTTVEDKAGPV
jgi:hypothetical protein